MKQRYSVGYSGLEGLIGFDWGNSGQIIWSTFVTENRGIQFIGLLFEQKVWRQPSLTLKVCKQTGMDAVKQ